MSEVFQESSITGNQIGKSTEDYTKIVDEIKQYVDSLGGVKSNFVFGNIAFSHNGEDRINIGDKLEFGEKGTEEWADLSQKNEEFGEKLNAQQCFSTTKYLKFRGIKILSLSFLGGKKELTLIPFKKSRRGCSFQYFDENEISDDSFGDYKPRYYKEYPAPNGYKDDYAVNTFRKTLSYYNEFHCIVKGHCPNIHDGYIYLIRPQNDLGGGFAALAYMYLKRPLDFKDLEIISQKLSLYFLDVLKRKVEVESTKSAIAAIMSRNMSHNLGSHFISNTKNYFGALIDRTPDNEANYRGIKHALQYIQERMDFIATITSTDTYPFGAVNAKAQIFDELAIDDFYFRHGSKTAYNFLMDFLVLSEQISKQSWKGDGPILSGGAHRLVLQMGCWDGELSSSPEYWNSQEISLAQNTRRDRILKLNFAIPGGILGRHAVFSIVENVIRNAAKHGQEKIQAGDFVIKMLYRSDERRLIVFDLKKDPEIKATVCSLNEKLMGLHFLNNNTGALAQEHKGLKEMLICAIWLQNENVAQVISEIDAEVAGTERERKKKLEKISKYLKVVAVNEDGVDLKCGVTTGYLGFSFKLDIFERVHYINARPRLEDIKGIKADIICADQDYQIGEGETAKPLSRVFPRFLVTNQEHVPEELLRAIVQNNCGDEAIQRKMVVSYTTRYKYDTEDVLQFDYWNTYRFIESQPSLEQLQGVTDDIICSNDDYELMVGQTKKRLSEIFPSFKLKIIKSPHDFNEFKANVERFGCTTKDENAFIFKEHAAKSKWDKFSALFRTAGIKNQYVDSISGGDFTYTLIQPTFAGVEYNLQKIKESVATRFIIIDERVYEHYKPQITLTHAKACQILSGLEKVKANNKGDDKWEKVASYVFRTNLALGYGCFDAHKEELIDFVQDGHKLSKFLEKDLEQLYLERRGIFVFNLEANEDGFDLCDLSSKKECFPWQANNAFGEVPKAPRFEDGVTTFLSVHLGLIDKIREQLLKRGADEGTIDGEIVAALEAYFGASFVSIHSGRGGFDVRDSLRQYTFQSFSAIENPLYNSKYLLSQQFYNLSYYGAAYD